MTTEPASSLEDMIRQPSPQDVLGAIFAYSDLPTFPSERRRLHDFVRRIAGSIPGASDLLSHFIFSQGADLYPFSRTLENTLVHLQLGGVIYAKNPEFNRLGMTPEARQRTKEKAESRFDENARRILEEVGNAFREEFPE